MRIKFLQDIHLSDIIAWDLFKTKWNEKHYEQSHNVLTEHDSLNTKFVDAEWFNNTTDLLYRVEHFSDPTFKDDKIVVSIEPPVLNAGEIYFQIET